MADAPNDHSGSRWEPDPSEQRTEQLGQPTDVIPGLQTPAPAKPKRRVPRAAAAVAIVAAATLGGGIAGMALAGNQTQDASDTGVSTDSGGSTSEQQPFTGPDGGTLPEGRDGDGDHGHFGHGPGGHR